MCFKIVFLILVHINDDHVAELVGGYADLCVYITKIYDFIDNGLLESIPILARQLRISSAIHSHLSNLHIAVSNLRHGYLVRMPRGST